MRLPLDGLDNLEDFLRKEAAANNWSISWRFPGRHELRQYRRCGAPHGRAGDSTDKTLL